MKREQEMKVRIYTDGACSGNPGIGGWALAICDNVGMKNLSGGEPETTNNRMELNAVLQALILIYERYDYSYEFEIYCDSAYVVNSINNGWAKKWQLSLWRTSKGEEVKNQDLWVEILKILKALDRNEIPVNFIKVKGHSGNIFNELVDSLAKAEVEKIKYNLEV